MFSDPFVLCFFGKSIVPHLGPFSSTMHMPRIRRCTFNVYNGPLSCAFAPTVDCPFVVTKKAKKSLHAAGLEPARYSVPMDLKPIALTNSAKRVVWL